MTHLVKAIALLCPEAEFTFKEEDYSTIEWIVEPNHIPTQKEINDAITLIQNKEKELLDDKIKAKSELLVKLGITEEEAKLLLS